MDPKRHSLRVAGLEAAPRQLLEVRSPFDGELVGEVELLDAAGMQHALEVARGAASRRPRGLPAHERRTILLRLADGLRREQEAMAMLIAREGGKPIRDARVEALRAVNTVELAAEEAVRVHGEEIPMQGSAAALGRLAFSTREPIGVVAAVSAFNHPLNLIAHQVAPAIAAGCPVLIKPAADTPLSCMVFMELAAEAGLPAELGAAVPCSNEVAELLVTSEHIDYFSFIGSAKIGWYLRSRVAAGVRCALEHGGAAPVIVDRGADLARTAEALLKGGYYHAGQVCVSVQRVFVHRSLRDELVERLRVGAEALVVGDPSAERTEVGPLIRAAEVERVDSWVKEAVAGNAELLCGGKRLLQQCYAPTVLVGAPRDCRVATEEIFGPVIAVQTFDELPEAIAAANGVRWSFQAAIFTPDVDRALGAARQLNASAVMINDHSAFRVDWMPFGGRGPSGLSMGGVAHAVHDMTQDKLIVFRSSAL